MHSAHAHVLYRLDEHLDVLRSARVLRRCADALVHRVRTLADGVRRNVRLKPSADNT